MNSEQDPKITVAIRKRPISKKELQKGEKDIVEVLPNQVTIQEPRLKVDLTKYIEEHIFTFDAAFDDKTSNKQLYAEIVFPLVTAAFAGTKITCFAYGQTGSGKTHTMLGNEETPGMYLLAAFDIFSKLQPDQTVTVSFYEIYCEKLYDLLNEKVQLNPREDAKGVVNIVGLSEKKISSVDELMEVIESGNGERVTAQNSANNDSSRSHAILQITIKQQKNFVGKLSFIDLAGSERGADVVDQNKQTRIDGAEINKSLLALKECIRALDLNKLHTPFRGSKLTLVLKDSFIGNCKTVMIGTICPTNSNAEHSLNTLRYADRVKELKKAPNENEEQQDYFQRELFLARQTNNVKKQNVGQVNFSQKMSQSPPPNLFEAEVQVDDKQKKKKRVQQQEDEVQKQNISPNKKKSVSTANEEGLSRLSSQHDQLIQQILSEEEDVIFSHRQHIDELVEITKQEMYLLHVVDQPGSSVDDYVLGLDEILVQKLENIKELRKKLLNFRQHLQQEEELSKQFHLMKKKLNN